MPKGDRGRRKERTGVVVSNKMDKTVTVKLERVMQHPLYGKSIKRVKQIKVHDGKNACQIGDTVRIAETRPLSKDKHWRVVEIVKRVGVEMVELKE
jgi:small subunit ribosomal protein S17